MREIKFRVFDTVHKEMTYFDLNGINDDGYVSHTPSDSGGYPFTYKSDASEIMQYTGLKDRNGKDIYEGDILITDRYPHIDDDKQNYVDVVEWCFAGFHTVLKCVNPDKWGISDGINEPLEDGEYFEVIGNIYENPELTPE